MNRKRGMQVVPKGNFEEPGGKGGCPKGRRKGKGKGRIDGTLDIWKEQKIQKHEGTEGTTGRWKKVKKACNG